MSYLVLPAVRKCLGWGPATVTVQGEGRVPDLASRERLLGRVLAVFQEPRCCPDTSIPLRPLLDLLGDSQVTLYSHHHDLPAGVGEGSREVLPEDAGAEDEDTSDA